MVDYGWNCRDHAWLTALLLRVLKREAVVLHGEAWFIAGPTAKSGGFGVQQQLHTWVSLEDVGAIDLSIKPEVSSESQRFRLPISCVFANDWNPRGRGQTYFFRDSGAFSRATTDLPRRPNHASAVYLVKEGESVTSGFLAQAAAWINSPLTDQLRHKYGDPSDVYCALLLHLGRFLHRGCESLSALSPSESWAALAHSRAGAIEQALQYVGFSSQVSNETQPVDAPDRLPASLRPPANGR